MRFVVDMYYFRSALAAVKPHVSKDKDDTARQSLSLHVREDAQLMVLAGDGSTSGLARVEIDQDDWDGELGYFTITPDIAATIIAAFTPHKSEWDISLEVSVTFSVEHQPGEETESTIAHISIRRLGQLFGGDQYKVSTPVQPVDDIQKIWDRIAAEVASKRSGLPAMTVNTKWLAAFKAAEKVYGESPVFALGANGSLLLLIGSRFIGHMWAEWKELDDSTKDYYDSTKHAWETHFPRRLSAVS